MYFDGKNDMFRGNFYFLSNMYESPVTMPDGLTYRCAEAAFQAQKCVDMGERERFANLGGKEAKRLGRRVNLRRDWNQVRVEVMREVVSAKFSKNQDLARRLIETEGELVENNTWGDKFWGVCRGVGKNHLGRILMDERESLQA
jgi:ribA/ribD-fused uncharacterized protein